MQRIWTFIRTDQSNQRNEHEQRREGSAEEEASLSPNDSQNHTHHQSSPLSMLSHAGEDSTNYFSAGSEDAFEYTDVSDASSLGSAPVNSRSIQTGAILSPDGDIATLSTPITSNASPIYQKRAEGEPSVLIRNFDDTDDAQDTMIIRPLVLPQYENETDKNSASFRSAKWSASDIDFDKGYDEPPIEDDDEDDGLFLGLYMELKESKKWVKCMLMLLVVFAVALIAVVSTANFSSSDQSISRGEVELQFPPATDFPSDSPSQRPKPSNPPSMDIFEAEPTHFPSSAQPSLSPVSTSSLPIPYSSEPTYAPTTKAPTKQPTRAPTRKPTRPPSQPAANSFSCTQITRPDPKDTIITVNNVQRTCSWLANSRAYQRILCTPPQSEAWRKCPKICCDYVND